MENLNLIVDWQSSQEVFKDFQNGADVRGVTTNDLAVYGCVGDDVVLSLLHKKDNPLAVPKFQKDVYDCIVNNDFFIPKDDLKEFILSAIKESKFTVKYSELSIKTYGCSSKYCYVESGEKNTVEDKKLLFAVYGTETLCDGKRVYLPREDCIKTALKDKSVDDFVVRACYFYKNQDFYANIRYIDGYYGDVRGVRRKVDENNTQKED